MQTSPISLQRHIAPEDQSRADMYALLARLFADAPDVRLLHAIANAPPLETVTESELAKAWDRLRAASGAMDAQAAAQEYTDLFVGVGKCEVNLHESHWRTGFMAERPLALLRSELAAMGLARQESATMLEDHLSALCETMRMLIVGDIERAPASVDAQRSFSLKHLFSWVFECCAAIENSSIANYYVRVAEFTRLFLALERDSLAIE